MPQRYVIPSVTHGPDALGTHTLNEEILVSELEPITQLYAVTASLFLPTIGRFDSFRQMQS